MAAESKETATATLLASFGARRSRRSLFKGALATGVALTGASVLPALHGRAAGPEEDEAEDSAHTIFTIARTAERLAITLYTNGVANADTLRTQGLELDQLHQLKAALIEEQIHELFFAANGGDVLTSTFSFPDGPATFTNLALFIKAQQQLEGAFDSAFIAAVEEFALMGRADLARIACQIAMIESEHRALGRDIADLDPADNWAFAPKLVEAVGDAPAVLQAAGYLSPRPGNSFTYQQADFNSPSLHPIYQTIMYKEPFAAPEDGEDGEKTS